MIVIQGLLIVAFIAILLRFLNSPNTYQSKAWQKIIGLSFFVFAMLAVLMPDLLTIVANKFGVGRGADLLLYFLTLSFIFVTLKLYIKSQHDRQEINNLARKIAIMEAQASDRNTKIVSEIA